MSFLALWPPLPGPLALLRTLGGPSCACPCAPLYSRSRPRALLGGPALTALLHAPQLRVLAAPARGSVGVWAPRVVRLALQLADDLGVPAPISAASNGQYIRARQMGFADKDFAAVRAAYEAEVMSEPETEDA